MKLNINANRIASIVTFILAVWIFFQSKHIVTGFNEAVGPGVFPRLVSIIMMILSLGIFILPGDSSPWAAKFIMLKQGLLILLLALFGMTVKSFGFIPSSIFVSIGIIKLFGANWMQSIISGVILSISLYLLFEYALGIPLPNIPFLNK